MTYNITQQILIREPTRKEKGAPKKRKKESKTISTKRTNNELRVILNMVSHLTSMLLG